jgi:peptidoglycan/LPS O-acetylase OafA/YrhL
MKSFASTGNRIAPLDGFRGLAILLVIMFHYFVRFTPDNDVTNYYPYGNLFSNVVVFRNGYLGVHLFFMISGFVIYMTLERCKSLKEFAFKRFIRLWPTLLICSLLTFIILSIFPFKGFETEPRYFLSTLTITQPRLWTRIFHFQYMGVIDGVIWSLTCEINFYIVASILFFYKKDSFVKNWFIYVAINLSTYIVFKTLGYNGILYYFEQIFYPQFLVFFTMGMYFYLLYRKVQLNWIYHVALVSFLAAQLVTHNLIQAIFILTFVILFFILIYRPLWYGFFNNKFTTIIGLISYPLYLLHQNIGIVIMNKLSKLLDSNLILTTALPTLAFIFILSFFVEKLAVGLLNGFIKRVLSNEMD